MSAVYSEHKLMMFTSLVVYSTMFITLCQQGFEIFFFGKALENKFSVNRIIEETELQLND